MTKNTTQNGTGESSKYLAMMEKAVRFSSEFWNELFARACDIDVIHSVYASLAKKLQAGENEEALNLLYAMNLFDDVSLELPMKEICESSVFISVFMSEFLDASEEDIEAVEEDARELHAELGMDTEK